MTLQCFRFAISVSILVLFQCGLVLGQLPDYPDDEVAGIPVNYTEAKAGKYALPDPLTTTSGAKIVDANAWQSQRRPELVKIFEENEYGLRTGAA